MRPTRAFGVGQLEGAAQFVAAGCGLHEAHRAVLPAEVKLALGADHGGALTAGTLALLPHDLARLPLETHGDAVVVPAACVNVVTDADHAAVVILKGARLEEVFLLSLHALSILRQLKQRRAGAVSGRSEHVIIPHQRGRNVGCAIGHLVVSPEGLAIAGAHADETASDQSDVLLHTAAV